MILEIREVCKSFHQPRSGVIQVLDRVSFSLGAGETNAVIGQSGSGKTTLLSLIAGLDNPDSGQVILDGENLCAMKENRLARYRALKIGIIFQQFHLMPHLSARENISLPLEILKQDRIRMRTDALLEKVGLGDRQHHLPGQLSGGGNASGLPWPVPSSSSRPCFWQTSPRATWILQPGKRWPGSCSIWWKRRRNALSL